MHLLSLLAVFSAVLPYVAAHGFVSKLTIDGKSYTGNEPNNPKVASPIRIISTNSPVKGADNPNLFCGQNAKPAELVADANPGSKITVEWLAGGGQLWPHNTGPIVDYLTSTGSTPADQFNSAEDAAWFKLDQAGKKPDNPSQWVQQDFMDGKSYSFNLPEDLAPGDYLLRHEIIALHIATQIGGAEFYPACFQIRVGGTQTGTPKTADTVKFPGAYSDNDPGILVPNVFNSDLKYVFPGPEVATLVSSGGSPPPPSSSASSSAPEPSSTSGSEEEDPSEDPSESDSASSASRTSTSTAPAASASSQSGGKKGQCKLKKRAASANANATDDGAAPLAARALHVDRPRHFSRIMGRLLHKS